MGQGSQVPMTYSPGEAAQGPNTIPTSPQTAVVAASPASAGQAAALAVSNQPSSIQTLPSQPILVMTVTGGPAPPAQAASLPIATVTTLMLHVATAPSMANATVPALLAVP